MSTRGRMPKKIIDKYNLLCPNGKEEAYYRAYSDYKLTIDLIFPNLKIVPEYKWSKEYELRKVITSPLS